jgi:hypothetical protein
MASKPPRPSAFKIFLHIASSRLHDKMDLDVLRGKRSECPLMVNLVDVRPSSADERRNGGKRARHVARAHLQPGQSARTHQP